MCIILAVGRTHGLFVGRSARGECWETDGRSLNKDQRLLCSGKEKKKNIDTGRQQLRPKGSCSKGAPMAEERGLHIRTAPQDASVSGESVTSIPVRRGWIRPFFPSSRTTNSENVAKEPHFLGI